MQKANAPVWASFFLMALLPGISGMAYADTVIDTTPSWVGIPVGLFGPSHTETYGQTVTVPLTDPVLKSWTFYMQLDTATHFQGEVYAWNGKMATGPNLFESPVMTTTNSNAFQAITFDTGGLALTPGDTYVLFASTSKDARSGGGGDWGIVSGSAYTGGAFYFMNNGNHPTQWTADFWDPGLTGFDLAFKADFDSPAAVPEPSAPRMLLATVLCAMFVLTRLGRKVIH